MASLNVFFRGHCSELIRLRSIHVSIGRLDAQHRYAIAELLVLRLFDSFEQLVSQTAFRLACGAKYLDASDPVLSVRANSIESARSLMLTHGRAKAKSYLEWSKASMIVDSVRNVLSPADHFVSYCQSHGNPINQLRLVRNVIAHNNKGAKDQYCSDVLQPRYGSDTYIRPGMFLLTLRFGSQPIENLFAESEVMARELVKG